jgi:putative PEP-CTERM system histidine kinase
VQPLISFWSHALASAAFLALLIWQTGKVNSLSRHRLLLASFAATAIWAGVAAISAGAIAAFTETVRNLLWIALLYRLSASAEQRQHGVRLVYTAVGAVIGLQMIADGLSLLLPGGPALAETATLLRITAAAGSLVLVHNIYGQASPASRPQVQLPMLALALLWTYDLNLYTVSYFHPSGVGALFEWRGAAVALAALMFALAGRREEGWRIRLSRAATFQSLSLLAITAYFATMAISTTALRGSSLDWSRALLIGLLSAMTLAAALLMPSDRARRWARVMVAKHLFEHRYDYRAEWLRFTELVGSPGPDAPPLGERLVKAFADMLEARGGILLAANETGIPGVSAVWNWPGRVPPAGAVAQSEHFWREIEQRARILEIDLSRGGWTGGSERLALPPWLDQDPDAWVGVPLLHQERLVGLVLLAAPEPRRPLDWEDFDLLRTAGQQAASVLAEAQSQEALADARRFEEFNRRFAFILHDIKNLVSQLSLLSRNAERHADNPEFRADMVATLRSSVGKMNDLLVRLSPGAGARPLRVERQALRDILFSAVAARRGSHDIRLLGDTHAEAMVDAPALEQAIGHLLQNALEASPPSEPVTVHVGRRGTEVVISVADQGAGMDGEFIRNRLFKPFVSTKSGGFGVGAFEARALVAAMGGELTVDSRPGAGTRFNISLAAAPEAAVAPPERKIA